MVDGLLNILQAWRDQLLAAGAILAAVGAAIAALAAVKAHGGRRISKSLAGNTQDHQQQIQLLCEDARVLTDLAIQRHMDNATFHRRLVAQPCYSELYPLFSTEFRKLLQFVDSSSKVSLALACRAEIDRIEQEYPVGQMYGGASISTSL